MSLASNVNEISQGKVFQKATNSAVVMTRVVFFKFVAPHGRASNFRHFWSTKSMTGLNGSSRNKRPNCGSISTERCNGTKGKTRAVLCCSRCNFLAAHSNPFVVNLNVVHELCSLHGGVVSNAQVSLSYIVRAKIHLFFVKTCNALTGRSRRNFWTIEVTFWAPGLLEEGDYAFELSIAQILAREECCTCKCIGIAPWRGINGVYIPFIETASSKGQKVNDQWRHVPETPCIRVLTIRDRVHLFVVFITSLFSAWFIRLLKQFSCCYSTYIWLQSRPLNWCLCSMKKW